MGQAMRKRFFVHMRTAKTQISLRIRAVWSGPSLYANRIIGFYRINELTANARLIHAQDELGVCILFMLEGTFSLDSGHII